MGWYDRKVRRVRDLSCGDTRIYLELEVRRVDCRNCRKVKREQGAIIESEPSLPVMVDTGKGGDGNEPTNKGGGSNRVVRKSAPSKGRSTTTRRSSKDPVRDFLNVVNQVRLFLR